MVRHSRNLDATSGRHSGRTHVCGHKDHNRVVKERGKEVSVNSTWALVRNHIPNALLYANKSDKLKIHAENYILPVVR